MNRGRDGDENGEVVVGDSGSEDDEGYDGDVSEGGYSSASFSSSDNR